MKKDSEVRKLKNKLYHILIKTKILELAAYHPIK